MHVWTFIAPPGDTLRVYKRVAAACPTAAASRFARLSTYKVNFPLPAL